MKQNINGLILNKKYFKLLHHKGLYNRKPRLSSLLNII
jgi:hypothetical protein